MAGPVPVDTVTAVPVLMAVPVPVAWLDARVVPVPWLTVMKRVTVTTEGQANPVGSALGAALVTANDVPKLGTALKMVVGLPLGAASTVVGLALGAASTVVGLALGAASMVVGLALGAAQMMVLTTLGAALEITTIDDPLGK